MSQVTQKPECSIDGCTDRAKTRGWCPRHYGRWARHGDPLADVTPSLRWPDNFLRRREEQPDGCIHWTGNVQPSGYAQVSRNGTLIHVHRAAYEWFVGPIPVGHHIDHTCHDPTQCVGGPKCLHRRCTNPDHLEAVTPAINVGRSGSFVVANARKTECANGHPFDEENTYERPTGGRHCRECMRAAGRRWRERNPRTR